MSQPPIGAMRRRLVIESPVETPDLAGGVTRAWTALGTVWAAVEPVEARAGLDADAPGTAARHRITLRWRGDLTAACRLRDGARLYRIAAVTDPDGRRRRLVVAAETFED